MHSLLAKQDERPEQIWQIDVALTKGRRRPDRCLRDVGLGIDDALRVGLLFTTNSEQLMAVQRRESSVSSFRGQSG